MNCPFCNKRIEGMTGLIEATKFRTHLVNCKKYPDRYVVPNANYPERKKINLTSVSFQDALKIRAESGQ